VSTSRYFLSDMSAQAVPLDYGGFQKVALVWSAKPKQKRVSILDKKTGPKFSLVSNLLGSAARIPNEAHPRSLTILECLFNKTTHHPQSKNSVSSLSYGIEL